MEQKDIDIYEILKGMPDGTPLYTPMCGNVEFISVEEDKEKPRAIWTENKVGAYAFDKHGKWTKGGEALLFPSKEMRDWSKFAWKKGDVLVSNDRDRHIIFKGFSKNDYTTFEGKHWISVSKKRYISCLNMQNVQDYHIEDNKDAAQTYINTIEKRSGGKLNRETLEIEKPAFEIGKLYVFDEEDEDGDVTVIGKLIGKNESEDTLSFGDQYEIETEKFVTDQAFDLRISVHDELREATEDEVELFNKHYSIWKEAKEQPAFKPFDKVLVRNGDNNKWLPAFFIRDIEEYAARFNALPIHFGRARFFTSCIPFEGNEHLAFTDKDFKDLTL
nr:MAG TPA: hypothetical protein [Caudoviricetes sp.]